MKRLFVLVTTAVLAFHMVVTEPAVAYRYTGGTTSTYVEGDLPQVISSNIAVSENLDEEPASDVGTVSIVSGFTSGDMLSYEAPNCITDSTYDPTVGVLTLRGQQGCESPDFSRWQQAFRVVKFSTTADAPDTTRVITFTTDNRGGGSHSVTVTVSAGSPEQPLTPTVTVGDASATVTVSPASSGLPALSHIVTATPGGRTCIVSTPTGSCTIDELTNGTSYTFSSISKRLSASSPSSASSTAVTPQASNHGAPDQVEQSQSTPVVTPALSAAPIVKVKATPKVSIGKKRSAKVLAKLASLKVTSRSRVKLAVASASKRRCRVSSGAIQGLRVGTCRVRVAVTTKGKTKSKTVVLRVAR